MIDYRSDAVYFLSCMFWVIYLNEPPVLSSPMGTKELRDGVLLSFSFGDFILRQ